MRLLQTFGRLAFGALPGDTQRPARIRASAKPTTAILPRCAMPDWWASASKVFSSLSLPGLVGGILLATPAIAHLAQHGCTAADEDAADMIVDHMNSWAAVTKAYRLYRQCDDGDVAEGNSEAIGQLLAKRWATIPEFSALTARTPGLEAWVLGHIDTTLDTEVLSTIHRNATASCPPGATRVCRLIAAASRRALRAQ